MKKNWDVKKLLILQHRTIFFLEGGGEVSSIHFKAFLQAKVQNGNILGGR